MDKKNVDNLKSLLSGKELDGNIQLGYGSHKSGPDSKGRKPGDMWEHNGKMWMVNENGTVTNVTRFDDVRIPMFCPRCSSVMRGKTDTKSFYNNGTCINCMIDDHDKMRREGTLEKFAWKKRISSAISWYKDQLQQFHEMEENYKKNPEFVLSDGTIEKWSKDTSFDKIIIEYRDYLNTYKQELDKGIEEYERTYNEKLQ